LERGWFGVLVWNDMLVRLLGSALALLVAFLGVVGSIDIKAYGFVPLGAGLASHGCMLPPSMSLTEPFVFLPNTKVRSLTSGALGSM